MTVEQWQLLRKGDTVWDVHHHQKRHIFAIKRISGKRGQRGNTRVALTVTNLKQPSSLTILFLSDNTGPRRFEFVSR